MTLDPFEYGGCPDAGEDELFTYAKEIGAPIDLVPTTNMLFYILIGEVNHKLKKERGRGSSTVGSLRGWGSWGGGASRRPLNP